MKRVVNGFTSLVFLALFLGMSAGNVFALPGGPMDGVTGSPADNGSTCTMCHTSFTLDSGTLKFSITAPSDYTLGEAEDIVISFDNSNSDMAMFGFELSALDANNNHVGTFNSIDGKTHTNTSTDYIKHTEEGHDHMGPNAGWQVQWTPSGSIIDPVTFYAAGNECNGDDSPAGDRIYTATTNISAAGAIVDPTAGIKANNSSGFVTIAAADTLTLTITLTPGSATGNADWWLLQYASSTGVLKYYDTSQEAFVVSSTVYAQTSLVALDGTTVSETTGLAADTYTYVFAFDLNPDGVLDLDEGVLFYDLVTVTVKGGVSFKDDVLPLFSSTDGYGAWFNYGNIDVGDSAANGPATSCGACHAGEVTDDGIEGDGETTCVPECHLMDLNTHAGWLAGADGGTEPLLGESVVGNTDYDWSHAKLRKRLRNNRMPPGMPFNVDETNRMGGDVILTSAADGNDIALGGQFSVSVAGTSGAGEVEYTADHDTGNHALGLLGAYVDGLNGTPTTYAGGTAVVFADIAGLFSKANVFYLGGQACTDCHGCSESEPPCYHLIDFNTEAGLLAGADGGEEPLLGESVAGTAPFDWSGSGLRARLKNNRMPPNAAFDIHELTRKGPELTHPITGLKVRAVDLIGEWVTGPDGVAGTSDDALNN